MKNTSHKRYILLSSLISSLVFIGYVAAVYVIDPAGVNNRFDLGLVRNPGLAFRTQKFAEMNTFKPDTVMLGGSRIHFLDTDDVKKYTHDRVYNIGLSGSTLREQYAFLSYAIAHFEIKHVIIGVNLYPFSENPYTADDSDFDETLLHSGFTLQKQVEHYLEVPVKKYLKQKWESPLYKNGSRTAYNQKIFIDGKPWEEREKKSNDFYREIYSQNMEWGDSGLKIFEKTVQLCKKNNIDLKVFTTAIYASQLQLLCDLNETGILYRWKRELAAITPYWDFMYLNSVTTDPANYIDPSHLRQERGYLYFAKIFHDKETVVPHDFGVYVNEETVDAHLAGTGAVCGSH